MAHTIAASLQGRDNNFNLVRFIAASAVLADHSFTLVSPERSAGAPIDFEALEIGRGDVQRLAPQHADMIAGELRQARD